MPIGLRRWTTVARVTSRRGSTSDAPAVRCSRHHRVPRLHCTDYRDALAARAAATGRGISKQTFNIMREDCRARSLDRRVESTLDHRGPSRVRVQERSTATKIFRRRKPPLARTVRRRLAQSITSTFRPTRTARRGDRRHARCVRGAVERPSDSSAASTAVRRRPTRCARHRDAHRLLSDQRRGDQIGERLAQSARVVVGLGIGLVLHAWPEEAAQPILATPRHDVHMKVSDALADDVVDRDERAVAIECRRHARRDTLHAFEQRPHRASASRSARVTVCCFGATSTCPLNTGDRSRKAIATSSRNTARTGERAGDRVAERARRFDHELHSAAATR